jgi:A/G-specific adenine glycosylase
LWQRRAVLLHPVRPLIDVGPKATSAIRRSLVAWFRRGHRDMPWRRTKDPYAIWISEIMLQQTRVETVRDNNARWMTRLPTVRALAEAPLDEVLALWSGLGYYARARNLHAAATQICVAHEGEVPRDPLALRALPGVGDYTAGAIASIAFGLPEPIVDGNVARVLCRVFLLDAPAGDRALQKTLWTLARSLVPDHAASAFNQAMMELGATLCTPRAPACEKCPLAKRCRAHAESRAEELPRKKVKRAVPICDEWTLVVRDRDERLLLGRRPERGLWGGLWEPPRMERAHADRLADGVARATTRFGLKLLRARAMGSYTHELTHRRYRFHAVSAESRAGGCPRDREDGYEELRWIEPRAITDGARFGLSAWARRVIEATTKELRR